MDIKKINGYNLCDETAREEISKLNESMANQSGGSGLTSTAKNLLISILQNAIYETDQSAIIQALKTELDKSGTSNGGNDSGNDSGNSGGDDNGNSGEGGEIEKTYYNVLASETNCTVESSSTSIEFSSSFDISLILHSVMPRPRTIDLIYSTVSP